MLFECSCEATQEVIDLAINNSIPLRPVNGSPLAQLVSSTTLVPITDLTAKLGEEVKAIPMDVLAEQSNNGMHNGYTDEIANQAAKTINNRIDIIKTTVIPVIKSITEAVFKDIAATGINENTADVVRYSACDMIFIPSFMEEVKRNTALQFVTPYDYFEEAPIPLAKVFELLHTGSSAADTAIKIALNRIGDDNLFRLWESLFVERASSTIASYGTFDEFIVNSTHGLDQAIIIFQLASKLGSSNSSYSLIAKQYKEAAAFYISLYSRHYNNEIENNKLIRSVNNGVITVYTVNYTKFLQQGGTPELVIGAATNQTHVTVDAILANSEQLLKEYRVLKSAKSLEVKSKIRNIAVDSFRNNFYSSFKNDKSEFERNYFEEHKGLEDSICSSFESKCGLLSAESVSSGMYRRVTEILCFTRFSYIDCHTFMCNIDEYCQEGLTPEEALTQATLQEICQYIVSGQITK